MTFLMQNQALSSNCDFVTRALSEKFASQHFVDPLGGDGTVLLTLLRNKAINSFHFNDSDPNWVKALDLVKHDPERVLQTIDTFLPTNSNVRGLFREDALPEEFLLKRHYSYGGYGEDRAVIPGRNAAAKNDWLKRNWDQSKESLISYVSDASSLLNSVPGEITCLPWEEALPESVEDKFVWLDVYSHISDGRSSKSLIFYEDINDVLRELRGYEWLATLPVSPEYDPILSWTQTISPILMGKNYLPFVLVNSHSPAW